MESLYQEYLIDKGINGETDKCYMLEGKHQVIIDIKKHTVLLYFINKLNISIKG